MQEQCLGVFVLLVLGLLPSLTYCFQASYMTESQNLHHDLPVDDQTCTKEFCGKAKRHILYDVNPGEGFNLRRDVYLRAAVFVKGLNEIDKKNQWILVLPPWGPLPHWKNKRLNQEGLDWQLFFDIAKLNEYVPVCEFDEYISERKQPVVDKIFYLLSFDYSKIDLQSEWLLEKANCEDISTFPYAVDSKGAVHGWFWGFHDIYAKKIECHRALGSVSSIIPKLLAESAAQDRSIMFDRFETLLHDRFGGKEYWQARRSMQFSPRLVEISRNFLKNHKIGESPNSAKGKEGGSFVCAHLRRQDYLRARPDACPSMREAALQLRRILHKLELSAVFIATDGTSDDIKELRQNLQAFSVLSYEPSEQDLRQRKDGGAAIVDQAICRHARHFIGSHESTFSFRIQEEREILGFPPDTTFNRFCQTADVACEQPTRWRISDSDF